jgi:inner membrane protein
MDTLTHALSGALIARATAPAPADPAALPIDRRVMLGFFAAAFPDIDIVSSLLSPLSYLYHHRGVTHSLVMLPLWALLFACVCAWIWRSGPGWRAYFGVFAWSIGLHIAGDWITSFGTMVFAPFSDMRVALSTTFIIDLWFTGIIVAGLLLSVARRRSRAPALAGLAALAAYVAFQFALQQQAIGLGEAYAQGAGLERPQVTALPRPVSPFNWMVIVADAERYHYSLVNLARHEPPQPLPPDAGFIARLSAPYLPPDRAVWMQAERYGSGLAQAALAREAFQQPQFAFFRWFAEYPVVYRIEPGNPSTCVWFQDLRFFTPGRDAWPFRYGMCRDGGRWLPFELLRGEERLPVY